MSMSVIHNVLTDEFVDLVTTEVLVDYYGTMASILEDNARDLGDGHSIVDVERVSDVMNALTLVLEDFMSNDQFQEWLEERS